MKKYILKEGADKVLQESYKVISAEEGFSLIKQGEEALYSLTVEDGPGDFKYALRANEIKARFTLRGYKITSAGFYLEMEENSITRVTKYTDSDLTVVFELKTGLLVRFTYASSALDRIGFSYT